jgi:ABC-type Fe3+ transport system substrate-binding protein
MKVVLTHAVQDVERWLTFMGARAASIGAMGGSNVVDHVAADGSKTVAISMDVADMGAMQAGLASPPPELAAAMQRHGVIPPVTAHIEK